MTTHTQENLLVTPSSDRKKFFLTVIPGLESVTHLELCEKWGQASEFFSLPPSYPHIDFFRGGLEFEAPVNFGLFLNHSMRSLTRVLMRLDTFPCESEAQFLQGLEKINWSPYFAKGDSFDFQISSKSSRLSKDYQIEKLLKKFFSSQKVASQKGAKKIFIRMFRDQCQVSLDTTGERAQFRGTAKKIGKASLRESTAAGLLRILLQGMEGSVELIDPMCGSGTFLQEALSIGQNIERKFSYQSYPDFKKLKFPDSASKLKLRAQGFDIDAKVLKMAEKNLGHFDSKLWTLKTQDLFQTPSLSSSQPSVVIVNPPWGKRLRAEKKDIVEAIYESYRPQRLGILVPARWKLSPIPMEKVRDIPLLNSGVENRFILFASS